ERHALEPVPLPEAVLEEEPVVTRQASTVGDLEAEARRCRRELGHVEELQPAAPDCGGLARRLDLREEAVELRRSYPPCGPVGEVDRSRQKALDPAAGRRG